MTTEPREASWSAPALWRFGQGTEFNAKTQRCQGAGKTGKYFASLRLCSAIGRNHRALRRFFYLPHEFGLPRDMQPFVAGATKGCHQKKEGFVAALPRCAFALKFPAAGARRQAEGGRPQGPGPAAAAKISLGWTNGANGV